MARLDRVGLAAAGLLCTLAFAAPVHAAPAAAESASVARFQRGRKLAQQHRCREAIIEFQASMDLAPSPNTRLMLGRCYLELGQTATAHVTLTRAGNEARDLAAAGDARYQATADAAFADSDAIAAKVPRITFTLPSDVPQSLVLTLDGQPLPVSAMGTPMELDPGPHAVAVKGSGVQAHEQHIDAHESQNDTVAIVVERLAGAAAGEGDAWTAVRNRAAASEEGESVEERKEEETRAQAKEQKRLDDEKAKQEAAAQRAPLRQTLRFTVGLDVSYAAGKVAFGDLVLNGTNLNYGASKVQMKSITGPALDLVFGIRQGLSSKWEFVASLSAGTFFGGGISSYGDAAGSENCLYTGSDPNSICNPSLEGGSISSSTLGQVLAASVSAGLREFTAENGPIFWGIGVRVSGVLASGTVTETFVNESTTTTSPPPDSASVHDFSVVPGIYGEFGGTFGPADDWILAARLSAQSNGTSTIGEIGGGLAKAF